jgi:hypothetical protein
MIIPTYILLAMGFLGAADIVLYHTKAHALRQRRESRAELVTHALRGPTYAALFLLVPNYSFHGGFVTALLALLVFDVGISLADFWLEPQSRASVGGLPRGEYILHTVLAMLFGGLVATVIAETGVSSSDPSALVWKDDGAPMPIRAALALMAPVVLASGILDFLAVLRLGRARS